MFEDCRFWIDLKVIICSFSVNNRQVQSQKQAGLQQFIYRASAPRPASHSQAVPHAEVPSQPAILGVAQLDQMFPRSLLLVLSVAIAGGLALPAGEDPASASSGQPQPAEGVTTPDGLLVDDQATEGSDINPNNIFGNSCGRGLESVDGQCVHVASSQPGRSRPPLPFPPGGGTEYDDSDNDAFLRALSADLPPANDSDVFNSDDFNFLKSLDLPPVDETSASPATEAPTPRTGTGPLSVSEFIDSLSDEEFLKELMRGAEGSPAPHEAPDPSDPSQAPVPDSTCAHCRHGLVLISVGSVFLVASLVLALWALVRWRGHKVQVNVMV